MNLSHYSAIDILIQSMLSTECKKLSNPKYQKTIKRTYNKQQKECTRKEQKKSERTIVHSDSTLKGGGYLLSRIALQYHRRNWA